MSNNQGNKNLLNNTENMAQRVLDNTNENSRRTSTNNQGVNNSYSETPTPSTNENEGSNTVIDNQGVNDRNNENNNETTTGEDVNPPEVNESLNKGELGNNENETNNTEFKQALPKKYTKKSSNNSFQESNSDVTQNNENASSNSIFKYEPPPANNSTTSNVDETLNDGEIANNENNTGNNTGEGVNSPVLKTSGAEEVNDTDNQVNQLGPNTGLNNVFTNNAQLINKKLPAGPPESNNNMGPVDKVKNLIDRCNNLQDSYNLKHKEFMYLNNLIENTLTELNNVKTNNSQINSAINKLLVSEDKLNNKNLQDKLNEQKAILEKLTGKLKEHQINTRNNEKKILDNRRAQIEAKRSSNLPPQLNPGSVEILEKNPNVQRAINAIVRPGNRSDLVKIGTLGKTIKKRKRNGKSGSKKKKGSKKNGRKSRVGSKRSSRIKIVRRT